MPRQVIFNGAVISRPGAATKIDASQFVDVTLGGVGIVAIVGEAEGGPPQEIMSFVGGVAAVKSVYGRGDIVEAAAILAAPANDDNIVTGAQKIVVYKVNAATQSSLTKAPHVFKSADYGLQANMVKMTLVAGTTTVGRVVTVEGITLDGEQVTEVSPSLGETAKLTVAYVGAGSACAMTVSDTQLTTSVTGGPGGEDLTLNFADFRSLQEVIAYIDAHSAYTCTALVTNVGSFDPTYLDGVTAVPIKARTGSTANIVAGAASGQMRLTGLTGQLATDVGQYITISGAGSSGNNGTFKVAAYVSATSVDVYNPDAVVPDANNGALSWTTTAYYEYATNFDLLDWVNNNSSLITDDVDSYTKGSAGPIAVFSATGFTGGTRGTSSNTDWVNAFAALQSSRVNQIVALCSADAETEQGTFTFSSVLAALTAHCKAMSSTAGRSERQGFMGAMLSKTALISAAQAQNSAHVVLTGQELLRLKDANAEIGYLPAWSSACALAGMRAGAPAKMPLTFKFVDCFGVRQDDSWSDEDTDDVVDLTRNGVTTICTVRTESAVSGFRTDKVVTTYTRADNDAFVQENIVHIWKFVGYELRRALEQRYVGQPGTLETVLTVPAFVAFVLDKFVELKMLTASRKADGTETPPYRDISVRFEGGALYVGVTITPTPGIDYVLNTITLVPASIAA